MSLAGQPLGGWGQYSLSPTMGAWNAHLFYLHWRYTVDDGVPARARLSVVPRGRQCLLRLLKPDANGVLEAAALLVARDLRQHAPRLAAAEQQLRPDLPEDALPRAGRDGRRVGTGRTRPRGGGRPPTGSATSTPTPTARCCSPRMKTCRRATGTSRTSSACTRSTSSPSKAARGRADHRGVARAVGRAGHEAWCGYSFSWMAALRARVGDAEAALRNLDIFAKAFILRNGFHANGDQTRSRASPTSPTGRSRSRATSSRCRPCTRCCCRAGARRPGSATPRSSASSRRRPARWHDASFDDLRAEGGHRVSARRENNATTWFRIAAGRDGVLRIRDNFGGRVPPWNRGGVRKAGANYEVAVKAGDQIEAHIDPTAR